MAIADPKAYATKKQDLDDDDDVQAQLVALQAQVQTLLQAQSGGGLSEERLERILLRVADVTAKAQERAANPSNKVHPHISVFSYPEGDIARPRPDFKCPMFWVGYPLDKDTTTAEELELLNLAEPGVYTFKRTDKSTEQLTVEADRDPAGNLSRLLFRFPIVENRETLPAMTDLLRDAFKVKTPEQMELERLRQEVAALTRVPVTV